MKSAKAFLVTAIFLSAAPAIADGIIAQLPPDGNWAEFEVHGEGVEADGSVSVTLTGKFTLSSVGGEMRDAVPCRWIEIETAIAYQRGEKKNELNGVMKLLIPEKFLAQGQNPAAHVLAAWKKDGEGIARELNLKGDDAREIASLDEIFHDSLNLKETMEGVEVVTPAGAFNCTKVHAMQVPEKRDVPVEFSTQTWLSDEAPFGVVAYRYDKFRRRDGAALGGRWMEWKLAKTGKNAKSKFAG